MEQMQWISVGDDSETERGIIPFGGLVGDYNRAMHESFVPWPMLPDGSVNQAYMNWVFALEAKKKLRVSHQEMMRAAIRDLIAEVTAQLFGAPLSVEATLALLKEQQKQNEKK